MNNFYLKVSKMIIPGIIFVTSAFAQKVDYKSGVLSVDGQQVGTVTKTKDAGSFGLTSTYEFFANDGKRLINAAVTGTFKSATRDDGNLYYQIEFMPLHQTAVFNFGSFGTEKEFAKLVGQSGIIKGNELDEDKVKELITYKAKKPKFEYEIVHRPMNMNVFIRGDQVRHGMELIGTFADKTRDPKLDTYEFMIPNGTVIATATFTGGNGAQKCTMTTYKDQTRQTVWLKGGHGEMFAKSIDVDRNSDSLKEMAEWLVKNHYL